MRDRTESLHRRKKPAIIASTKAIAQQITAEPIPMISDAFPP